VKKSSNKGDGLINKRQSSKFVGRHKSEREKIPNRQLGDYVYSGL